MKLQALSLLLVLGLLTVAIPTTQAQSNIEGRMDPENPG